METTKPTGLMAEFKEFIATGNLLQIAVAFVMGAATAAVIDSFVKDIFNGLIAAILGTKGGVGLAGRFNVWNGNIHIGSFIDSLITFIIFAFVVFMIVKAANTFLKASIKNSVPQDVQLLTEIRDLLRQGR